MGYPRPTRAGEAAILTAYLGECDMRNMSFSMTVDQIRDGSKTVTRRLGWLFLNFGDL